MIALQSRINKATVMKYTSMGHHNKKMLLKYLEVYRTFSATEKKDSSTDTGESTVFVFVPSATKSIVKQNIDSETTHAGSVITLKRSEKYQSEKVQRR